MTVKKYNLFQEVEDYDVLDVTVIEQTVTKEQRKKIDEDGNLVEFNSIETVKTIFKKEAPKESTGIKATCIVVSGFATLIGVLSDLPGAIEFVGKVLQIT